MPAFGSEDKIGKTEQDRDGLRISPNYGNRETKCPKIPKPPFKYTLNIPELLWAKEKRGIAQAVCPAYNGKEDKEDNEMSLVGLWLMPEKNQVVAFADSKSTKIENWQEMCDEARTPVQKIFAEEGRLMVTWGQNSYRLENGNIVVLERIVEECKGMNLLFGQIQSLLKAGNSEATTQFLYVNKNYPVIGHVEIGAKKITNEYFFETNKRQFFLGGCGFYTDLILKDPSLLEKSPGEFKEKLEEMVRFKDTFSNYNPVGIPIRMVEWNWGL